MKNKQFYVKKPYRNGYYIILYFILENNTHTIPEIDIENI